MIQFFLLILVIKFNNRNTLLIIYKTHQQYMKIQLRKFKKRKIFVFNIHKAIKHYYHKYKIKNINLDSNIFIDNQSLVIDIFFMESSFQMIVFKSVSRIKIIKLIGIKNFRIEKLDFKI